MTAMKGFVDEVCAPILLWATGFSTQLSSATISLLSVGLAGLFLSSLTAFGTTYYIDYTASNDSANGTAKATPWKRHPYMAGWAGSYSHSAGDRFIFKGGVTWPSACFPMTLATGGSTATRDYYGVDQTWHIGSSWSRPVFDGEYVAKEDLIDAQVNSPSNLIFDGLELCHLMASRSFGSALLSVGGAGGNVTITNCYIHGWQLVSSISADDAHGGVIGISWSGGGNNMVIDNCVIENSENTNNSSVSTRQNGIATRSIGTVRFSIIHDVQTAMLGSSDVHHNDLYNINYPTPGFNDGPYHPNSCYIMGSGRFYSNLLHDYGGGASPVYIEPNFLGGDSTSAIYCYNNVVYGHQSSQMAFEIDPEGVSGTAGHVYCYNNTVVNYNNNAPAFHVVNRGSSYRLASLTLVNNHVIGTSASLTDATTATCASTSNTANIIQSVATAAGQGYVLANKYAPTSGSGSTVRAGTNLTSLSLFTSDRLGVPRPSLGAWDIGAYQFATGSDPGTRPPSPPMGLMIIGVH